MLACEGRSDCSLLTRMFCSPGAPGGAQGPPSPEELVPSIRAAVQQLVPLLLLLDENGAGTAQLSSFLLLRATCAALAAAAKMLRMDAAVQTVACTATVESVSVWYIMDGSCAQQMQSIHTCTWQAQHNEQLALMHPADAAVLEQVDVIVLQMQQKVCPGHCCWQLHQLHSQTQTAVQGTAAASSACCTCLLRSLSRQLIV